MKNNENGRSMVEMLGVLAIIGVLSAGGLAGYSKAMFKHKLNTTVDQITMLATNIRTMYGSQGNYAGLDNGTAVALGIIPAVMDSGSGSGSARGLTNPFKGPVYIGALDIGDVENGGFGISYEEIPNEACIALATMDFGGGAGSGYIGTQLEDTDWSGEYGQATEGKPYSMSEAIAHCWDGQQIKWKFY